jgi:hypothetical protein
MSYLFQLAVTEIISGGGELRPSGRGVHQDYSIGNLFFGTTPLQNDEHPS